ncbi:hypothetical protein Acor_14480 [Acrocarpospora corrugata]|uniref:ABC transporter permease n=1 Tax=Acrocarpospora corrugata TaxID=35763 RepID=A0A5M3VRH6_9ACTN|nr:hypothetical protein [Acrocarpospora corrugata]GER99384.1 hypothetical protein Acor_14480 [Acrocarpospora corrugata]
MIRRVVLSTPVVAIGGALLLTTLVLVVVGVDPAVAYPALIRGAVADGNLEYTIAAFVPTLGMAFAIPLRAGQFNLGGDGQLSAGGIAAAALALLVPLPPVLAIGLPLVVLLAGIWWYADGRTVLGYEIRATGHNREFARYGGVRVDRLAAIALAGGGGFAGLAGGLIVLGPPYRFVDGALTAPGYTFTAVAAVLLAAARPAVVPVTVALLTVLQVGGQGMEREAGVPSQLTQIVQGLIIVIVAVFATVRGRRATE